MKNLLVVVCLVTLICVGSQAQVFKKGANLANVGIGFGAAYSQTGLSAKVPPLSISYEHGINEQWGLGGFFGYYAGSLSQKFSATSSNGIVTATLTNDVSYFTVGLRGVYHFKTTDKYDLYGSAMLGYNAGSAKLSVDPPSASLGTTLPAAVSSGVIVGAIVGGRYFFTESIGAFAELGYGFAYATVGLSAKF